MASSQGEPDTVLLRQLSLIHSQVISILSSSVEKMFARNPSYDVRKLLGMHTPLPDSARPLNCRTAICCHTLMLMRSQLIASSDVAVVDFCCSTP